MKQYINVGILNRKLLNFDVDFQSDAAYDCGYADCFTAVQDVISDCIHSNIPVTTKEEARKILRDCGIMDSSNQIMPAYRNILMEIKE